jgi:hypothetical protein
MLRVDTSEAETFLEGMWKDQIPFAASLALNTTAKDAQRGIQTHVAGEFILRRADFVLRETAKIPRFSTKTDRELSVEILATDKADFMRKFEAGTPKTSRTGGAIAVPGEWKLRDEIIPKHLRPRALQLRAHRTKAAIAESIISFGSPSAAQIKSGAYKQHARGGKVQLKGKHRTFVLKPIGIFQRIGPKRSDIRLLYLFKKQVVSPAVLMFKQTAEKVIAAKWTENFAQAFSRAVRSAK